MQLKVQRIGESYGVLLPEQLLKALALAEGSMVNVEEQAGSLRFTRDLQSGPAEEVQRQIDIFLETESLHRESYRELAK